MNQPTPQPPRWERFDIPAPVRRNGGHGHHRSPETKTGGWVQRWQLAALAVVVVVTLLVFVSALSADSESPDQQQAASTATQDGTQDGAQDENSRGEGPVPGEGYQGEFATGELPPGGPYAEKGSDKYQVVGQPSPKVGEGRKDHYTYVVEVEDTVDASRSGGGDAFAAMVDATLSNPKSWIGDKDISFEHVDESALPEGEEPDLRIQLTSTETTHDVCGFTYRLETSCNMPIGNRVVINDARWMRGALPFNGDLGSYRQYVINHEVGHGIGYAAHQGCRADGALAPVMMQQTLSLNNGVLHDINPEGTYGQGDATCRANPWPYPTGGPEPDTETENGIRNDS